MTLVITTNNIRDYQGNIVVTEGQKVEWRVQSTTPNVAESVLITPSFGNFSEGAKTINYVPGSGTGSILIAPFQTVDDKIFEPNENFYFRFEPVNNAILQVNDFGGIIQNNDFLPTISINARQATLLENATDPTFKFDLSRTGEDLSMVTIVELRFTGTGDLPADQADFTTSLTTQLVRFEVGETLKTIEMKIANDAIIEGSEALQARIWQATSASSTEYYSSVPYNPISKYTATVSILNDDPNPPNPGSTDQIITKPSLPPVDIYRFYNSQTNTHFFTASPSERDIIQNTFPSFKFEGVGFKAAPDQIGADPVFRFYNTETNTHFFTPSIAERDHIVATFPTLKLEGIGFYASDKDGGGLTEVYRFYNEDTRVHFYTPSILEKNTIQEKFPSFHFEGVAFYVPDSNDYSLI